MIKRFLILTIFCSIFLSLFSCNRKEDDSEMMIMIQGTWDWNPYSLFHLNDREEKYEFIDPQNCKYYSLRHEMDGLYLIEDSLTINILDSKLYIKYKDGSLYGTYPIKKLTTDELILVDYKGEKQIFHRLK